VLVALPICVVIFGNYIIMNLFISILLQGFGEDDDEEEVGVCERVCASGGGGG